MPMRDILAHLRGDCKREMKFILGREWGDGERDAACRGGRGQGVGILTRSRSVKNVADAKLERTSLSADVFQGSEFQPIPPRGCPDASPQSAINYSIIIVVVNSTFHL